MPTHQSPLRERIADALEDQAEDIVREWIEWLLVRVGTRAIHALPVKALENHIPCVVQSLSAFLRAPVEAVQSETIGHLRLHAQVRKEQGYDVQELMVEFDYLTQIINARMASELEGMSSAPAPREVAEAFILLNTGLRAMGFVTVGIYREQEEDAEAELSRRLRHFADTLAHEIRQPMQTISMSADVLATRIDADGDLIRYVDLIRKGLQRTGELMDDLCLLGAAEAARQEKSWRSLGTIVDEVVDELRPWAAERGVMLVVQDLPAVELLALPVHLALLNLVSNAVKYADVEKPEPRVEISASWAEEAKRTGACRIHVEDNGIGIPVEVRSHVFQRHFRAHPQIGSGLGLGLAIARHTLQQYSGELTLESEVGKGSIFTIRVEGRGLRLPGKASGEENMHDLLQRSVDASMDQLTPDPTEPGSDS